MKPLLPANSLDFVPRKLRLQFSVSKSNNSEALLSVIFQDTLKVNRNFKKIKFRVIKIFVFQLSYRRNKNNLPLYLFPAYTSWQSLLGHLSCKHPFSSPLEPWLLHTCAVTLRKMETGARFQFHTQSVSHRKEGRKGLHHIHLKKNRHVPNENVYLPTAQTIPEKKKYSHCKYKF